MPDQEKSPIVSTSVGFGTAKKQDTPQKKVKVPWHILVCSNLGFTSEKPEPMRASSFDELIASHDIVLRGTFDSAIAEKPFFIEYPLKEYRDFSSVQLQKKLPLTGVLQELRETLCGLLDGKITREQAITMLKEHRDDSPLCRDALLIIDIQKKAAPADLPPRQSKEKSSALDSILDAVSVDPVDDSRSAETPPTPVGKLAEALAGDMQQELPKQEIQSLVARIESNLENDISALAAQQFFSDKKASWTACRHLVKRIGRNDAVSVSVFSASSTEIADLLPGALTSLEEQGNVPDILLFDYPVRFTNAHADILARIGEQAEQYNMMTLAYLALEEPLVARIPHADTIKPFFDDPSCIPYKRLRKNSFARTLCLNFPHGIVDSGDTVPVSAGGAWLVLFALAQMICDGRSPFDGSVSLADMGLSAEFPLKHSAGMTKDHSQEAAEQGITLLSEITATRAGVPLVTVIDPEDTAPSYTSFAYNLLVNRLLKITASVIREGAADRESLTDRLRKGISAFLDQYNLLHAQPEVAVTPTDSGGIDISIDSQKTVDGYPVRIQYSVQA